MCSWKKLVLLGVVGIAIAGIVVATLEWYYTPYRNTRALFPNTESGAGYHLTECGGTPPGADYFRFNTVNHVFYYEYTFTVMGADCEGINLTVSLSQDGGALMLRFDFNYTFPAFCACFFKVNGYVAGLSGGTHDMTVLNRNLHFDPVKSTIVGTFQVTI